MKSFSHLWKFVFIRIRIRIFIFISIFGWMANKIPKENVKKKRTVLSNLIAFTAQSNQLCYWVSGHTIPIHSFGHICAGRKKFQQKFYFSSSYEVSRLLFGLSFLISLSRKFNGKLQNFLHTQRTEERKREKERIKWH